MTGWGKPYGVQRQAGRLVRQVRQVHLPWGKPYDSADARHMCSDRRAVWCGKCGKCISLGCLEVHSRHYTISVVDQR